MAGTIDKTTRVSLGILCLLVPAVLTGAIFLSSLSTSVQSMTDSFREVRQALDRNTAQIVDDGKSLVVLQTQVQDLSRRVLELERKK